MKSGPIVGCVLSVILAFSACGSSGGGGGTTRDAACQGDACAPEGNPDDNSPPDATLTCGGAEGETCPDGYRCIADPAVDCDTANGSDCPGLCVLGEELPGCGGLSAEECPDGYACMDDPDDDCVGGPPVDCPGVCQPVNPGVCSADDECPVPEAPCMVCADGSLSCIEARCVGGQCVVDSNPCSEPQVCGGLSGLECEPGFHCVDDPSDGCIPERDDTDCRGICLPDPTPLECGGFDGAACPPGFECTDDLTDECDLQTGGADCPGFCEPAPGEECVSDDECPELLLPCPICPDGTSSCPRSFCDNGRCSFEFPTCGSTNGCSSDGDCAPGQVCRLDPDEACDPTTGMACSGVCVPNDEQRPCGGPLGDTCPPAYQCVDDRNDDCDPDEGADCPGVCVPQPPTECSSDRECATVELCPPCPDGSFSCPSAECVDGQCIIVYEPCSEPGFCGGVGGFPCPPGSTCVDDRGDDCDPNQGGADCPGVCVPSSPEQCSSDSDCVATQACRACPDGSFSCPSAACVNGVCSTFESDCPPPDFCGGIAGFPCPPGFTCIDDDGDDCDPNQGGADCGGVCVREQGPEKCGGIAGDSCAEGYECVDVPDDCDPATGADCPGYCRPIGSLPCASDADCPAVAAPCQICEDGVAVCPRSVCEEGECRLDFQTCDEEENRG